MEFPTIIKWTSPSLFSGLLGGIFHFYSNFDRKLLANGGDPDQTPHSAVSDLGLHCLHMSHKKDTRLIWDKCMCSNKHPPILKD